jgi:hypothetical protein
LYAEVVRVYPEQREQAHTAQLRLAALTQKAPATSQGAVRTGRTDVSAVVSPLFEQYCIRCHNQSTHASGLALDTLNTKNSARTPPSGNTYYETPSAARSSLRASATGPGCFPVCCFQTGGSPGSGVSRQCLFDVRPGDGRRAGLAHRDIYLGCGARCCPS